MHDPQQQCEECEQHRLRPLAKRPQRERRGRAGDKCGERGIAGERRDREPEQAEADRDPPVQRDEYPDIGGDALAPLEAEPHRKEVAEEGAERGGKRKLVREVEVVAAYAYCGRDSLYVAPELGVPARAGGSLGPLFPVWLGFEGSRGGAPSMRKL